MGSIMPVLLEVLAQQVFAIVVAVGRAYHGVDVIAVWHTLAREGDRRLVVELDQDYRAMHAIVKSTVAVGAAHPGEVRFVEMRADLAHLYPGVPIGHVAHILAD